MFQSPLPPIAPHDPPSLLLEPDSPWTSTYATLSFHKSNTIRLLNFPAAFTADLVPILHDSWPLGIQSQYQHQSPFAAEQSAEFKFRGKPFGGSSAQQYVGGMRLVRNILSALHDHGWELVTSVMCSRRVSAKDTLVFRQRRPVCGSAGLPGAPPLEWLVLAPVARDKLRVVYDVAGAKQKEEADEDGRNHDYLGHLVSDIKNVLTSLSLFEKGNWDHESFEIQLRGNPWRSRGDASVTVRTFLIKLFELVEGHGWRAYVTLAQRTGDDEKRLPDTWYFVRERRQAV
ncbi:hypothetical protein VTH06DRAFT_3441 [Thermothelomyces fergusii]